MPRASALKGDLKPINESFARQIASVVESNTHTRIQEALAVHFGVRRGKAKAVRRAKVVRQW
jgi:hypothetical protein